MSININNAREELNKEFDQLNDKQAILRSKVFKELYSSIGQVDKDKRAEYGSQINELKNEFQLRIESINNKEEDISKIDVSAPYDINVTAKNRPQLLNIQKASRHPIMLELEKITNIFALMGFDVAESRQLDNEFNMFSALNFPKDHPARDDFDTFSTTEGLIPPAHTSSMQHRILKSQTPPIRTVIPGRVFRNEDLDATHEHTFYQVEGIYVDKDISLADMLGTIKTFLETYFEQSIEFKTQPYFFPFVEPGLEYLIKMPESMKKSSEDKDKWLEVMGCGLIHPEVLKFAGIDPIKYSGFAWGFGLDRLVMLKYGIEDVRLFHSAKLEFLRYF